MTGFRTKGKGKNRTVFPIGGSKSQKNYSIGGRKNYSDYEKKPPEENPSEEKVLQEKLQEQKAQSDKKIKHRPEKPSFSTRTSINSDIKNMMRKDDSDEHGSKDYVNYRKKLDHDADRTYSRENRKGKKRRKKETKREKKQQHKEQQLEDHNGSSDTDQDVSTGVKGA